MPGCWDGLQFYEWKGNKMPIYEYECQNCGHVFEEIAIRHQSFDKLVCRRCKGYGKRIISQNSFQLKGRGWSKDSYNAGPEQRPAA